MNEQTYQWPTAERVHEMFGNHPTDADTDKIKELLSAAFDDVANLPEGTYRAMAKHYDEALSNGLCPCGSKATFSGCCKNDWLVTRRGRAKVAEEAKAAQKEQHKASATEKEEPVDWLIRVGATKKGQIMLGAVPEYEGKEINPSVVLRMLREAANGLERQLITEDAMQGVFEALTQAQQAKAQAGPPKGMPLGPDGKPLIR